MCDNQLIIFQSIIVLILAFSSIGLILYGNLKKRRNLNILGFSSLLFTVFVLFYYFPEYTNQFYVWATVALAIAAYGAIDENRRHRLQDRQRDDKKKRTDC